jgi:hypothetical protein
MQEFARRGQHRFGHVPRLTEIALQGPQVLHRRFEPLRLESYPETMMQVILRQSTFFIDVSFH